MLGERLLRPALVSVAKKKDTKDEENKEKKDQKQTCSWEKNTHIAIRKGIIYEQSYRNRFRNH